MGLIQVQYAAKKMRSGYKQVTIYMSMVFIFS